MKILLIEDSPTDAILMSRQLRAVDIAVSHINDLPADSSEHHDCRVILLDLNLLSSDGPDTVRKCRELLPATPIVVLTSVEAPRELAECIEHTADSTLTKGTADARDILTALQAAVMRRIDLDDAMADLGDLLSAMEDRTQRLLSTL